MAAIFVFIHSFTSILAAEIETVFKIMLLQKIVQQLISESVLKSSNFTQTWDCNALECKRPYGESLNTSRVWSRHTNVNLKLQN